MCYNNESFFKKVDSSLDGDLRKLLEQFLVNQINKCSFKKIEIIYMG